MNLNISYLYRIYFETLKLMAISPRSIFHFCFNSLRSLTRPRLWAISPSELRVLFVPWPKSILLNLISYCANVYLLLKRGLEEYRWLSANPLSSSGNIQNTCPNSRARMDHHSYP